MKLFIFIILSLLIETSYAKKSLIASSYLWKAYALAHETSGSVFVIKKESEDKFAIFINSGPIAEIINLKVMSKYKNDRPSSKYILYEMEAETLSQNYSIQELEIAKRNNQWKIKGLRIYSLFEKHPLFIVHHGRSYGRLPLIDDCLRFCDE